MKSRRLPAFRSQLKKLPTEVQSQAANAYRAFQVDPWSGDLTFKRIQGEKDVWSVRVSAQHRAVGRWRGDEMVWFFIGTHAEYDATLARLRRR